MLSPGENAGGRWRTIRRGAVGLALFGIAGWIWRHGNRAGEIDPSPDNEATTQPRP
jgi:hypothetical protein